MLGKPARELPGDGFVFEPKWDGFRALVFRDDGDVDVRSRHGRPLARYFPEVVEAFRSLAEPSLVVDGEIVVVTPSGFDFAALMSRLHPAASRVERLARETPLAWHEVEAGAARTEALAFEPREVVARIERGGDLFRPVLDLTQPLRGS
jgi:ATP-dependent DNA ligase